MQQIRVFDLFLTGAVFFIAGASFTAAMARGYGWQQTDTRLIVAAIGMLIYGGIQLRAIYRRVRTLGADPDPRPNDR